MKLPVFLEGTLLRREKRFLSYVRLSDGREVCAHCPNPGSMRGNAEPGSLVRLVDVSAKGGKLNYRWAFVQPKKSKTWVCVDTMLANPLVAEALARGELTEYSGAWRPEVSFEDARFDFGGEKSFLEIKSVSMAEGNLACFPDSVTARGQKHLKTLIKAVEQGYSANLLFLVVREDCKSVQAARMIDSKYADLLIEAKEAGVNIAARGITLTHDSLKVGAKMPVLYV